MFLKYCWKSDMSDFLFSVELRRIKNKVFFPFFFLPGLSKCNGVAVFY